MGAINFGNDGKLYFTTGEHFNPVARAAAHEPSGQDPPHQPRRHGAHGQPVLRRQQDPTSTRSGRAVCATRSARPTTRRPAVSSSATSAATYGELHRGAQPRRGRAPTTGGRAAKARARRPVRARSTPTTTTDATRRSPAASSIAAPSSRVSTRAATSSPTTARTGSVASPSTPAATSPACSTSSRPTARSTARTATSSHLRRGAGRRPVLRRPRVRRREWPVRRQQDPSDPLRAAEPGADRGRLGEPDLGTVPLTVNFSSAGSLDPEGQPLTLLWTFGDGNTSTEANPSHTYSQAGPYTARLEVSDGVNTTQAPPINISAGKLPDGHHRHARQCSLVPSRGRDQFRRHGDRSRGRLAAGERVHVEHRLPPRGTRAPRPAVERRHGGFVHDPDVRSRLRGLHSLPDPPDRHRLRRSA